MSDATANGRSQLRQRQREAVPGTTRERGGWGFGQIATAGLVLVVLGLVFFTFGRDRPDTGRVATTPAGIPTVLPTPAEPVEETLLTVEFPAEAGSPRRIESGVQVVVIPPLNRSTWRPTCCPGRMVEYVVEGAYTVRAEAAIRVVRAGGVIEEVPAGTDVTLGPGDGLISRNETVVEASNGGRTPVTLLNWAMVDDDVGTFSNHLLAGWSRGDADDLSYMTVPERSVTVRLKRVALPPKTELPLPPSDTFQFCVTLSEPNATGTPVVLDTVLRTNGAVYNRYPQTITAYLVTVEFAGDPHRLSSVAGESPR